MILKTLLTVNFRGATIALSLLSAALLSLPWVGSCPGWALFIAFVPLLMAERRAQIERAPFFSMAFMCFWTWNLLSAWWVMKYAAVAGLLALTLNALAMAAVWQLYHLFMQRRRLVAPIALTAFWLTFEYLHYNWDVEWPFLTLGNSFAHCPQLVQWYEFTGVLGGSLWILAVNLLIFRLLTDTPRKTLLTVTALVAGLPILASLYRYYSFQEPDEKATVLVLQPNIDPFTRKFAPDTELRQVELLLHLADSALTDDIDYIVGPETALPLLWESDSMQQHPYLQAFTQLRGHALTVIGAMTRIRYSGQHTPTARCDSGVWYDVCNSALQIGRDNVQRYHKSKLVMGVEKMPFRRYIPLPDKWLAKLGGFSGSLAPQSTPTPFISARGTVAPIICYESLFGDYVRGFVQRGAQILFVMTNDGWWRHTPGYRLHLAYARLRAIETRRSIARAANTGISALINQRGDIIKQSQWWTVAALHGRLALDNVCTVYVRYGDCIGHIAAALSLVMTILLAMPILLKRPKSMNTDS
ncbi:MAG: apolipoprotein N-acyltransferase [Bacteroidales bacterium]|jgi:apolipoprotein N-acyltransferase|nr:apolipoprotein N-acyltransferase [Bacteroidales bacterium]